MSERPRLVKPSESRAAAEYQPLIDEILAIQRDWAPLVIADGPLGNGHEFSEIMATLKQRDAELQRVTRQVDDFLARECADAVISDPQPEWPDHVARVEDLVMERAWRTGDIGYKLGLAVGLLLGPNVFHAKTGALQLVPRGPLVQPDTENGGA